MLLFSVFDNHGPARAWPLTQAHLIGPEDLAIPGEIELTEGVLVGQKRVEGSVALAVQFPVDSPSTPTTYPPSGGLLTLRTCLLPERERPYLLSLELARHQVMLLFNKLEEWALFDHPDAEPAIRLVDRARAAFTHALTIHRAAAEHAAPYTVESDRLAREALALGVAAGAELALLQARVQHQRRLSGELARAAAAPLPPNAITDHEARAARSALLGSPGVILNDPPKVGCAINPAAFTPELAALAQQHCDFITIPMRWVDMEPTEGKYAFAKVDKWIEWAVRTAKLPVVAGPVLDFNPRAVPEWLYIWEHDYETLRDVIFEHVKTIVTRYRRTINTWTIASGLHVAGGSTTGGASRASGGSIALTYEQAIDLTRTCVAIVRKLHPQARVHVEIAQPWGEYTAAKGGSRSIPPVLYADLLNQMQTNVDAFGVRIHMGQAEPGRSTRDLIATSALLDRLASLDKPIALSAFGCPSAPPPTAPAMSDDEDERPALDPGYWRAPWSPDIQRHWLAALGAIAAGKPYVQSICWQDLYDAAASPTAPVIGEMPAGGLSTLASPPTPKPALRALGELRDALRARRTVLPGAQ